MRNLLPFLLAFTLLTSCVSTSTPKKVKRASKKLEKHLTGIDNIVKIYPELMDSLTTTVHDTIKIKEHIVDTSFIVVKDTAFIDKILYEFLSDDKVITKERIRYVRNEIIKEVLKDTTYFYQDSVTAITIAFKEGKLYVTTKVKEKSIPYVKQETTLNPKLIKQPAYKNMWFWILILIIIALLYLLRNNKY